MLREQAELIVQKVREKDWRAAYKLAQSLQAKTAGPFGGSPHELLNLLKRNQPRASVATSVIHAGLKKLIKITGYRIFSKLIRTIAAKRFQKDLTKDQVDQILSNYLRTMEPAWALMASIFKETIERKMASRMAKEPKRVPRYRWSNVSSKDEKDPLDSFQAQMVASIAAKGDVDLAEELLAEFLKTGEKTSSQKIVEKIDNYINYNDPLVVYGIEMLRKTLESPYVIKVIKQVAVQKYGVELENEELQELASSCIKAARPVLGLSATVLVDSIQESQKRDHLPFLL